MGQSADEIRSQIEQTRSELTDTATAIQDHIRPRSVAQRQLSGMRQRVVGMKEAVMGSPVFDHNSTGPGPAAPGPVHSGGSPAAVSFASAKETAVSGVHNLQQAPASVKQAAAGSPLAAGLIAVGAGMVIASLIPPSRQEQQAAMVLSEQWGFEEGLSRAGQKLRSAVEDSAQEAASQIKNRATEAVSHVADAGQSAAGELKDQAAESAHQVAGAARD